MFNIIIINNVNNKSDISTSLCYYKLFKNERIIIFSLILFLFIRINI